MSGNLGAKQKAQIARETERMLRLSNRQRLADMRASIVELRNAIRANARSDQRRRQDLLKRARVVLRTIPRREHETRRRMLRELTAARVELRTWWAAVRAERAERIRMLGGLRAHLADYRRTAPERMRRVAAAVKRSVDTRLTELRNTTVERRAFLEDAIRKAEAEFRVERKDQKQFARTRAHLKGRRPGVVKARPSETRKEFIDGVEQNLISAEEYAIWRDQRRAILADARSRGITSPDAVAELVRERVELEPDVALDSLQRDADKWLAAELRRKGYA